MSKRLSTLFIGQELIELDNVDSTNNYAANLINTSKVSNGTVIMAHSQNSGRGQMGNSWITEPGKNLTISVVLGFPRIKMTEFFSVSKMVSLAVLQACRRAIPNRDFQIKWPNDIYCDNKKIGGLLIENEWSREGLMSIIGIGLNVNQTFFNDLKQASSLCLLGEQNIDLFDLLNSVAQELEKGWNQIRMGKMKEIDQLYHQHLMNFNKIARYKKNNIEFKGTIIKVLENGTLCLSLENGTLETFQFKEIEFLI